uniref:hypothetical protein n=1 Tax=Pontibacterium sp. TaxID=2036026 RepID=UPI0035645EF4
PAVIGGGFGPFAAFAALMFFATLPKWLPQLCISDRITGLLWFCFLLSIAAITLYFNLSSNADHITSAAAQSWQALIFSIGLFYIGFFLNSNSTTFHNALMLSAVALLLFLAFYTLSTGKIMFYARFYFDTKDGIATYQGFARSAFFVYVILMMMARTATTSFIWTVLGTYTLFVLGARSEFFAFFAVALISLSLKLLRDPWMSIYILLTFLGLCLLGPVIFDSIQDSRQLEVLDLSSSTSWQARKSLLQQSYSVLLNSPFSGEFGGHIRIAGHGGGYVHNALSGWMNYGILPFLGYVLTVSFAALMSGIRVFMSGANTSKWSLCFAINISSLLLIAVSKPVFWPVPALGIGMYLALAATAKHRD